MKRSGVMHLAGVLIAAIFLLASSTAAVAAQYKMVPLSDEGGVQVDGIATLSKATITPDISACLGGVAPFAILGFSGPPNTTVVFKVTQTASGILGFSNSSPGPFKDTIDILVPLDASGNGQSEPFYLKGVSLGQTVVSLCNEQQYCVWSQASTVVFNVKSVEWEAVDSPLDANPNTGGGLRIFPDKASPGDTKDETIVKVKVTLSDELLWDVHLRAFDVDDPSSDNLVVDRDGSGGIDNRGTTPSIGYDSGIGNASGSTGPDGIARFTLKLSKQPGDNFRVAGACIHNDREGLTVSGVGVKDASGRSLPTDFAKITPLLTVWRRLHIEVDSMGPVAGNFVEGTVTKAHATNKGTTTLTLLDALADYRRFEKGRITIQDIGAFPVVGSSGHTVTVQGVVAQDPAGRHFTLVDDDDFNDNDGDELDGDIGEDLPEPNRNLVKESDDPAENVFAPAYVKPAYDLNNPRPEVPFALNSEVFYDYFDNLNSAINDKDFWTAYLLGAYQYLARDDRDGETTTTFGQGNIWGAAIFLEVGRPWEERTYAAKAAFVNQAATTAHELGHWFGAPDDDSKSDPEGGLMCWPPDRKKGTFSDKTLAMIRNKNLP